MSRQFALLRLGSMANMSYLVTPVESFGFDRIGKCCGGLDSQPCTSRGPSTGDICSEQVRAAIQELPAATSVKTRDNRSVQKLFPGRLR
jgi:hypothetical protein